jgi:hypothetical protein
MVNTRHRVKATWDDGWSGRWVHKLGADDPPQNRTITVQEQEDETLLFVEIDAEKFRVCRKGRLGF